MGSRSWSECCASHGADPVFGQGPVVSVATRSRSPLCDPAVLGILSEYGRSSPDGKAQQWRGTGCALWNDDVEHSRLQLCFLSCPLSWFLGSWTWCLADCPRVCPQLSSLEWRLTLYADPSRLCYLSPLVAARRRPLRRCFLRATCLSDGFGSASGHLMEVYGGPRTLAYLDRGYSTDTCTGGACPL